MSFPSDLRATFPENWPPELVDAAPATISLRLSESDARVLGSQSATFRREVGDWRAAGFSPDLLAAIETALAACVRGLFVRSGYCSWKASMLGPRPLRTLAEVMQVITADDPRIARGLAVSVVSGDPVYLHLRAWHDIPEWAEFRVFYTHRRVVGVSQYFWKSRFPQIDANLGPIQSALRGFLGTLWPHLAMEHGVLDVALLPDQGFAPLLLDIGPFSPLSDAGLFTWDRGGDFDGSFRHRRS